MSNDGDVWRIEYNWYGETFDIDVFEIDGDKAQYLYGRSYYPAVEEATNENVDGRSNSKNDASLSEDSTNPAEGPDEH